MSTQDRTLASPVAGAKRRALRRRSSAGGTMFVVAMTIAVLSTVGAWALQSAALEVRMAGYERQSSQTHYLAEYGLMATAQDLDMQGGGQSLLLASIGGSNQSSGAANVNYHAECQSIPCINVPSGGGCPTVNTATGCLPMNTGDHKLAFACYGWKGWSDPNFVNNFNPNTKTGLPLMDLEDGGVAATTPGSLGLTNMSGTFSTELSDLAQGTSPQGQTISGTAQSSANVTYMGTITSYGQTSTANSVAGNTASQGSEILRARVEIGPTNPIVMSTMCH